MKLHYMGDDNKGPRGGKVFLFHCPGCKTSHPFEVDCPNGNGWTWNNSLDRPTFSPSLLVNQHREHLRCHSFVRDGQIEYLDDCHHTLRGQTVELPNWSDDLW
jgi:hypothetical protein